MVFRIQPHNRLQEWVAEENGYFADEGLEYVFDTGDSVITNFAYQASFGKSSIASTHEAPAEVQRGAFESMEAGRACDISAACHWAVNMAGSSQHGKMWARAYAVAPSGIYVAPESRLRRPEDLAGTEVGVGYHSGSHFSALQGLEAFLDREQIKLKFIGHPNDRVAQLLDRKVEAVNVFGLQSYIVEQQGFRKLVDTTFMVGFLIRGDDVDLEDVEKYFRALQRAQRDIDAEHQRYTHYYLREMAEAFKPLVDVRAFGPGERMVFEPYTREVYEQTHRWMQEQQLFGPEETAEPNYEAAVLA